MPGVGWRGYCVQGLGFRLGPHVFNCRKNISHNIHDDDYDIICILYDTLSRSLALSLSRALSLARARSLSPSPGTRTGYGKEHFSPHNILVSVLGASLLWVGWFGFNAGSYFGADRIYLLSSWALKTIARRSKK